jgi:xanthine phosphoribosyltransferase
VQAEALAPPMVMTHPSGGKMKTLRDRMIQQGTHLGKGILKVDSFMNHQIDSLLMRQIGQEFARKFADLEATRILTAETSGIAPAVSAGMEMNLPVVFARKHQPITMAADPYREKSVSPTHGNDVELIVSSEYLTISDRIIIIDDFLATARTLHALVKLVRSSGATLVGIGAVIEKVYAGGRASLLDLNVPIEALVSIERVDGDKLIFTDEPAAV